MIKPHCMPKRKTSLHVMFISTAQQTMKNNFSSQKWVCIPTSNVDNTIDKCVLGCSAMGIFLITEYVQ